MLVFKGKSSFRTCIPENSWFSTYLARQICYCSCSHAPLFPPSVDAPASCFSNSQDAGASTLHSHALAKNEKIFNPFSPDSHLECCTSTPCPSGFKKFGAELWSCCSQIKALADVIFYCNISYCNPSCNNYPPNLRLSVSQTTRVSKSKRENPCRLIS